MEVALLKYPKKSHRKIISFPTESNELAELMGIALGDGGINNDWQLVISVNSVADLDYSKYVVNLCSKLFNINAAVRKKKDCNALDIVCSSTSLVDFLIQKGAVRGNKIRQQIDMPKWISGNEEYEKCFIRGLVDTDGCLYIHKHTIANSMYRNIGFCFSSKSKKLIYSVARTLKKFGIAPHLAGHDSKVYLYSEKAVLDYLNIFGSSNPRILNKYTEWRGA